MSAPGTLTEVELTFYPEIVNDWLRFGAPDWERIVNRRRSLAFFEPGKLFGYVRWLANDYGTAGWDLFVLRACAPGELAQPVPGVRPGADILCHLSGRAKVKRGLALIDDLEARGLDPAAVSPDWWRVAGNRLLVGLPVKPYGEAEHRAHLKRRSLRF